MRCRSKLALIATLAALSGLLPSRPAQAFFFCPPFGSQHEERSPRVRGFWPQGFGYGDRRYAWAPPPDFGAPIQSWAYDNPEPPHPAPIEPKTPRAATWSN